MLVSSSTIEWSNSLKIPIYQVDAFTSEVFKGNPAAVCPLKEWLPDEVMQKYSHGE